MGLVCDWEIPDYELVENPQAIDDVVDLLLQCGQEIIGKERDVCCKQTVIYFHSPGQMI